MLLTAASRARRAPQLQGAPPAAQLAGGLLPNPGGGAVRGRVPGENPRNEKTVKTND